MRTSRDSPSLRRHDWPVRSRSGRSGGAKYLSTSGVSVSVFRSNISAHAPLSSGAAATYHRQESEQGGRGETRNVHLLLLLPDVLRCSPRRFHLYSPPRWRWRRRSRDGFRHSRTARPALVARILQPKVPRVCACLECTERRVEPQLARVESTQAAFDGAGGLERGRTPRGEGRVVVVVVEERLGSRSLLLGHGGRGWRKSTLRVDGALELRAGFPKCRLRRTQRPALGLDSRCPDGGL